MIYKSMMYKSIIEFKSSKDEKSMMYKSIIEFKSSKDEKRSASWQRILELVRSRGSKIFFILKVLLLFQQL